MDRLAVSVLGLIALLASAAFGQEEPPPARPTSSAARHVERCLEQAGVKYDYIETEDCFRTLWATKQ